MLDTIERLQQHLSGLGATRVLFKYLAPNDNSKQQVYLGANFEALNLLPSGPVRQDPGSRRPNFKAPLDFWWIDTEGRASKAPRAQLILYPDYPEVRLSGFLAGCETAPSSLMQPYPRPSAGRVLFLGLCPDSRVVAFLVAHDSSIAKQLETLTITQKVNDVFSELLWKENDVGSKTLLLRALKEVHSQGFQTCCRLNNKREVIVPYKAPNAAGYTLEALLGIVPNGISDPDMHGWELKSYKTRRISDVGASNKITLMTPEPTLGLYREIGAKEFVLRYGRRLDGDTTYFTGTHIAGQKCAASGMVMDVVGFDVGSARIIDVDGKISLSNQFGLMAGWSFTDLIEHWKRKHSQAAYVPYITNGAVPPKFWFGNNVSLGEGTDINRFLLAIASAKIVYDPGIKVSSVSGRSRVKARSQFRMSFRDLHSLYVAWNLVDLLAI